jgi:hypothetical protein
MKTLEAQWPRIRVTYHGNRKDEIISVPEAARRYGLKEADLKWVNSEFMSGTSLHSAPRRDEEVYMLYRYTQEDALREAAPELLTALQGIMDHDLVPAESVAGKLALEAIRKATE